MNFDELDKDYPPLPKGPPNRIIKEGFFIDDEGCITEDNKPHYHTNEKGFAIACYHKCKTMLMNWQFWAGLTLGFPIEHLLWEKVWPFNLVTEFLLK